MKKPSIDEILNGYGAHLTGYDLAPELELEEAKAALLEQVLACLPGKLDNQGHPMSATAAAKFAGFNKCHNQATQNIRTLFGEGE